MDNILAFFTNIEPIITCCGLIVACIELFNTRCEQRKGWNRQKKQATLDAYSQLQVSVFDNINHFTPSEIREISEDNKSDEYKELSGYLARIEQFCVGLNQGIYDFDTFYELSHGYFDGKRGMLYVRIIPILETKGLGADEDYYKNIHKVWEKMQKMSLHKSCINTEKGL